MSEAGSTLDTSGWRFPQLPKRPLGRDLVSLALPPFRCQLIRRRDRHLLQSSAPRYMVGSGSFSARDDPQPGVTRARYIGFSASGAARRIRRVGQHCRWKPERFPKTRALDILVIDDPLVVRTARSWRGIVAFTHLAREGRMTVTIGRRKLLVALGSAAVWPL